MPAFEDVDLEAEQKDLLVHLVEAYRESREEFLVIKHWGGASIHHAGKAIDVEPADVRALVHYGFLVPVGVGGSGNEQYDLTPDGRRYYVWLKQQEGEPIERLELEIRRLLDVGSFLERHREAYDRWADAETKLWGADTANQFTDIGLACREAVQLFITDLVRQHQPSDVESNVEKTINRLHSVIETAGGSERVGAVADALVAYFAAVNGLFQRQVHGKQKGGDSLVWEDARRVVFQTAMVMFELDRMLGSDG